MSVCIWTILCMSSFHGVQGQNTEWSLAGKKNRDKYLRLIVWDLDYKGKYLSSFLPQIEKERERTIQCYSQEPHTFCYRSEIKGAIIRLKAKQSKNCRNSVLLSSHALQPLCVCLIYMACSHIGTHRIDYIRGWDLQIYTHINVCVCVCMCIYGASQEAQW